MSQSSTEIWNLLGGLNRNRIIVESLVDSRRIMDPDLYRFITDSINRLINISSLVLSDLAPVVRGLELWISDEVHGAEHSFYVYKKGLEIAELDNLPIDQDKLYLLCVIHDLAEFLPIYDPSLSHQLQWVEGLFFPAENFQGLSQAGESKERRWKSLRHPEMMAKTVMLLGRLFGFVDAKQLAIDVYYHDVFWDVPSEERIDKIREKLSLEGKVLADADRMVDGGSADNEEMVRSAIQRNWFFGAGKQHYIRPDIDAGVRRLWQKRTGALFDNLSALLPEFTAPEYLMHTFAGREMLRTKKELFLEILKDFVLEKLYRPWKNILDNHFAGSDQVVDIQYGVRSGEVLYEINRVTIGEAIRQVLFIKEPESYSDVYGRARYPYHLYVGDEYIDPSIVIFPEEEALTYALEQAFYEYEATLGH